MLGAFSSDNPTQAPFIHILPLQSNTNKSLVDVSLSANYLLNERATRAPNTIAHNTLRAMSIGFLQQPEQGNVLHADPNNRDMLQFALDNYVMSVTHLNNFLKCPLQFTTSICCVYHLPCLNGSIWKRHSQGP